MSGYYLQDSRGLVGDNLMWWALDIMDDNQADPTRAATR